MKNKVIKSRVIEATVLLTVPNNSLMRMVLIADSIDTVVLDLQEEYPDSKITRQSILHWKFMTVADIQKNKRLVKELSESGVKLFAGRRRVELPEVQECDATEDDSSNAAG